MVAISAPAVRRRLAPDGTWLLVEPLAGFTGFREVVDSPTNLVLEVRP